MSSPSGRSTTEAPATAADTVDALLASSGREFVPIRRSFVQAPRHGGGAGPLAEFVRHRRGRTLDLYLLAHAAASSPPFDVAYPSSVWARALGIGGQAGAASTISKSWGWLEERRLITSARRGRIRVITLTVEDGSGRPYTHPGKRGNYLKLPYAYWRGNFHNRINLPAKAILLIALSQRREFVLPGEHGARWYGLSRETVRRGLRVLKVVGLLEARTITKVAPLAPAGITKERVYSLREPFLPLPRGEAPKDDESEGESNEPEHR